VELKEFVRESLKQIVEGVSEAQEPVRRHGGYVNPTVLPKTTSDAHFGEFLPSGQQVFLVEFDVAVAVNEQTGTHAEAKLQVASFLSLGVGGKSGDAQQTTQRIKFKVPLALPLDAVAMQKTTELRSQEDSQIVDPAIHPD
jgi:hypothetical protein